MSGSRKLLIVANGLRDLVGHYFETSISLVEAAKRAGMHPVLGTHVDCPAEILPPWLESHPIFRTDHWMRFSPGAAETPAPGRLGLRSMVRKVGRRWRYGRDAALVERALPWAEISASIGNPRRRAPVLAAARRLAALGQLPELDYGLRFLRDLERFIEVSRAGLRDHVLLTTAHAREAFAVHLAAEQLGCDRSPSFHLEFRHPLFDGEAADEASRSSPSVEMQRAFLAPRLDARLADRVRLYTDAEALARDYESISDRPFGVLPLPFRAELIAAQTRSPAAPLTVAYLGEARDEKGFHWLPDLIESLDEKYLRTGRARLLIQANVSCPEHNPRSVEALQRLKALDSKQVELAAVKQALSPAEYYRLVSRADVVLLPYLVHRYRACTSGILAEALAAGAVAVVPRRTWLESQLPPGGGEAFDGFSSFVAAVKRVIDGHAAYRSAVQSHRESWLARHTPDRLVRALLEPDGRI